MLRTICGKRSRNFSLAIDLTLIPHHARPSRNKKEIVRGQRQARRATADGAYRNSPSQWVRRTFIGKGKPIVVLTGFLDTPTRVVRRTA